MSLKNVMTIRAFGNASISSAHDPSATRIQDMVMSGNSDVLLSPRNSFNEIFFDFLGASRDC